MDELIKILAGSPENIRRQLTEVIASVPPGCFLEIERTGTRRPKSLQGMRFNGDRAQFTREVERMFVDAAASLRGKQSVVIRITSN